MRTPNHIILDFEPKSSIKTNWLQKFLKLKLNTSLSFYASPQHKLNENLETNILGVTFNKKSSLNNQSYYYFFLKKVELTPNNNNFFSNSFIYNINFIRKERLYTKLKYSRSPAYDLVSGGSAALLAGFVGFLISEKYGFELVDSGDFYYLFMYLVFLVFSTRPLLTSINGKESIKKIFSLNFFLNFFLTICYLLIKKVK